MYFINLIYLSMVSIIFVLLIVLPDPKSKTKLDLFIQFSLKKIFFSNSLLLFSEYCFTKTMRPPEFMRLGQVMKPTGVISAKLHKQLLEDVGILSEEQAVGLGKHLVHRLLWKVDELPEEFCTQTEKAINNSLYSSYFHKHASARFARTPTASQARSR